MQLHPPTEANDDGAVQTRLDHQLAVEHTFSESIGKQE
jgi:hypothetical protein